VIIAVFEIWQKYLGGIVSLRLMRELIIEYVSVVKTFKGKLESDKPIPLSKEEADLCIVARKRCDDLYASMSEDERKIFDSNYDSRVEQREALEHNANSTEVIYLEDRLECFNQVIKEVTTK
tara:strand:- start:249 stop:614 length:366 start_codon:yes stop_codon:yes gene_type:complete